MHAQGADGPPLLLAMQILLEGPGDYTVSGGSSRCIQMVQNAASRIKQSRLMFTPTLFWVDSQHDQDQSPNAQARMQWPLKPLQSEVQDPAEHAIFFVSR